MERARFLIRNKLIFPKSNHYVLPKRVIVERFLCPYLKIRSSSFIFFQFSAEEGGEATAW